MTNEILKIENYALIITMLNSLHHCHHGVICEENAETKFDDEVTTQSVWRSES
jgi:hypothetical protein